MFDFAVFRVPAFSGAIFGCMGMNFSYWPLMIYLPIYFQIGLGYDSVTAGLSLLDLRGLGTARTLVLVNGRRHITATPGDYLVDQDEEPIESGSSLAWRRVATFIHLPAISKRATIQQMVPIDPAFLEAALERDQRQS